MKSENLTRYVSKKLKTYTNFIYAIGYFGNILCFFLACFVLLRNFKYLTLYIVFFIFFTFMNLGMRNFIKQLRPSNPVKFLDNDHYTKATASFGMPSGHLQSTFFSLTFIYLFLHKINIWVILLFIISILTFYERYLFRNHTLQQVTMGAIIGVIFGYITYYLVTKIVRYI